MSFENAPDGLEERLSLYSRPALCFAADVTCSKELYDAIDRFQDQYRIAILKVHPEIIIDWSEETIETLREYAHKYGFLIWADQKLCDVPHILLRQVEAFMWADIVSVMSVACSNPDILRQIQEVAESKDVMIVIVNELYTEGRKLWSDSSTFEARSKVVRDRTSSDREGWSDYPCIVGTVGKRTEGLCHICAGVGSTTPDCDVIVCGRSLLATSEK